MQPSRALDWDKWIDLALAEACSEPGAQSLERLKDPRAWAGELRAAEQMQVETQDMALLLDRDALWGPLRGLVDPAAALEALQRGTTLEVQGLHELRTWLFVLDAWTQMPREELHSRYFKEALNTLFDPLDVLAIINRVITPRGELSDQASPKLRALIGEVRELKSRLDRLMDDLVKRYAEQGVLQQGFSDVRDGRYVLPVKISLQSKVEGLVYEASVSNQTVFVEPREAAVLNAKLSQTQRELNEEIYRILSETSKQIAPSAPAIEASVRVVAHWDGVQAKARLARHYGGKKLTLTADRKLKLQQTAHPLLWWTLPSPEQVIRNDLELADDQRVLFLTGPNTGGKTVLLKTLGLLAVCARSGFFFPGVGSLVVPFFRNVFVDVGDSQSIEESVSSFSGHVLKFKHILENLTEDSLVLVDELNTATDPEEGSALARAFVESVMSQGRGTGSILVATTHDPKLKSLALANPAIVNGSMHFDEKRYEPTYQLILGVPGRSRAIETAERLGLPRAVIELARAHLSKEHVDFEENIAKLERNLRETQHAYQEAERLRLEAEHLKLEWVEKTRVRTENILEELNRKLRDLMSSAKEEVRDSVRMLEARRTGAQVEATRTVIKKVMDETASGVDSVLRQLVPEVAEQLKQQQDKAAAAAPDDLPIGQRVRVAKWNGYGKIAAIKKGKIEVEMEKTQMRLTLSPFEVEAVAEETRPASRPSLRGFSLGSSLDVGHVPDSIDLRGKRFDDAMTELESYLDRAFRSGRMQVTIVHGLGTGAIREGTRKLLNELPYVSSFQDGGAGHGGTGATVVMFDQA